MKNFTKLFACLLLLFVSSHFTPGFSQAPKLFVKDISFPSTNVLNVGNTEDRTFVLKNIGAPGSHIDTILFQCHQPANIRFYPLGAGNEKYYMTRPNDSVLANYFTIYTYPYYSFGHPVHHNTYSLDTAATHFNMITSAMIHALSGKDSLGASDSIIIHLPYKVISCNNSGGFINFWVDSALHHIDFAQEPINITIDSGAPALNGTPNITDSAYFCNVSPSKDTAQIGFRISNVDNTIGLSIPPYAHNLKLYLFCSQVAKLDTSTFRINGVKVSGRYIFPYTNSGYNVYLIKMTEFPAVADTGHPFGQNTLMDLYGNGFADDLAQHQSFELTATIIYNSNGCPPYGNCSATAWTLPQFVATYSSECTTVPFYPDTINPGVSPIAADLIRYFYEAVTNTSTLTVPADVTFSQPDFDADMCVNNYDQYWQPFNFFDCPNANYQLVMPMPRGYHLDTAALVHYIGSYDSGVHSAVFKFPFLVFANPFPGCPGAQDTDRNVTLQEFFTPHDSIIVNFGGLPLSPCNGQTVYTPNCLKIPLALNCLNFDTTNINIQPDTFRYRYQYICNQISPCDTCGGDVLQCGLSANTWHHCHGLCSFPPYTTRGWIIDRTNFGYENQNLPNFYDDCGGTNAIVPGPGNIVSDTIPIDSSVAYPGDQMKILVNGGFVSKPKNYQDIYLHISHNAISGARNPYFLFELDPSFNSYFLVGNYKKIPAMNGVPLYLPACLAGDRSCGDSYDPVKNDVVLRYSLYAAIKNTNAAWYDSIIHDDTNESMTISAHIFVRVRNDSLNEFFSYPNYLHPGDNVVGLRAEYMADVNDSTHVPSCDPWGGQVRILENQPEIGLSTNIGGNFTQTSNCDTFNIQYIFTAPQSVANVDDFPFEQRPIVKLDDSLKIVIPKGYKYAATQFFTFIDSYNSSVSDNHFAGGATLQYFQIKPVSKTGLPGGDTLLTYIGLNSNGVNCWPIIDQKSPNVNLPQGYYITVKTLPTCVANDTDTVSCVSGFRVGTQQSDPNYQVHIMDTMLKQRVYHKNPSVNVATPAAVNDYSDTIRFTFDYCSNNLDSPIPWVAFENTNGYLLDMSTATLYDKTALRNYPNNKGFKYFNTPDNAGIVFDLFPFAANTCDSLVFTAVVEDSSRACPPTGALSQMLVRFGTICVGNDTIKNPDSAKCENKVDTFDYQVYKATLSLFQDSYSPNPVCLKGTELVDSLILESANLGTVLNPILWIYPPAGITFDSTIITYPCDTVNFTPHGHPSSNGYFAPDTLIHNSTTGAIIAYGFIMDRLLHINGLPGTLATPSGSDANFMCLKVYLDMSCSYNKNNPIEYFATGTSTCNTLISSDTLFVKFHVDSTCCLPPVDSCALAAGPYDTIIRGPVSARQIHNGPITFYCKKILISGKFTVNENVNFNACEIAFGPYALIDVDSNHTLSIISGGVCSHVCPHLYAPCDTMWRGIFVEPGSEVEIADNALIEDADTAIYAENGGSTASLYSLLNSIVFNHCYKDIVVGHYTGAYQGKAQGCLFTNRDFSSIPNCDWRADYRSAPVTMISKVPNVGTFTKIGWQVSNVKHFEDNGGNDVYTGGNTFDNLQLGIDDYQSNMTICTDTFQNMTHGNPAIYSNNPGSVADSLNVGGPPIYHEPNRFYNCYKGVYCNGRHSEISIRYNGFINPPTVNAIAAINVTGMSVHGAPLIIEADTIKNYVKGIVCNMNQHLTANINYNTITDNVCSTNNWIGIGISENQSTDALYTIDSNKINILNYGIFENDVFNSNINANKINLGTMIGCPNADYNGSGIEVAGCDSVNIACNVVKAPPVSQVAVNHYIGIFEKQSKFVHIWDNTTQVEKVHIAFKGTPVMGTNLWDNHLTGNAVDTGIYDPAGVVGNMGSGTIPTDNTFNPVTWACSKRVAGTTYHISNPALYTPPTFACPLPFIVVAGTHHTLNCPTIPSLVNNKTARVLNNNGDTVIIDSMTLVSMYNTVLNKDTIYVNEDTNKLLAKIGVLGTLWQHQYLLADSIFKHFNDSMSSVPIGKIMAIDTSMVTKDSNLNYASLLSSLNGISPHNNIEQYLLTSTHGFLEYKINKDSLGSSEIATLTYVANLCAYWNGPGVYLARSVISPYDTVGTIYLDDCPTNNGNRMLKNNGDSSASSKFNLYPNPNSGGFTIDYNLTQGQIGQLEIYTMLGQKEAEYALDANNNRMNVVNNSLSNGIYLYVIRVDNTEVKRDKLIIIK